MVGGALVGREFCVLEAHSDLSMGHLGKLGELESICIRRSSVDDSDLSF